MIADTVLLIQAGLLVGLGTSIGSGCTSGHGICGIARLSIRSIVATFIFVIFGKFQENLNKTNVREPKGNKTLTKP